MSTDVTVAIPTIPTRRKAMLTRAVASATAQILPPVALSIAVDTLHAGAAATRNRALAAVRTEWVAFLDDDDELLPEHIRDCLRHAETTGADLIYPWFHVIGGTDPLLAPWDGQMVNPFGREFGPEQAEFTLTTNNFIPVTVLVRTELARAVGGYPLPGTDEWDLPHAEDWGFHQRLLRAGATFAHLPQRTWKWFHHGANTSGRGDRW